MTRSMRSIDSQLLLWFVFVPKVLERSRDRKFEIAAWKATTLGHVWASAIGARLWLGEGVAAPSTA